MDVSHETRTDLSDPSSRIMVLASALELAAGFIHIFQENLKPKLPRTSTQEGSEPPQVDMHVLKNGSGSIITVPWSIKNKYYSAEVHFASLAIPGLSSHLFTSVPAVIFIWVKGEAYKHNVERIAKDLEGHEPEVLLAVRIEEFEGGWVIPEEDREEVPEDNNAIDEFASSHGFEYVDATKDVEHCKLGETLEQSEVDDGIPGVVRVVDALSTIMWSSMKTVNKGKGEAPVETGNARWIEAKLANDPFMEMLDSLDSAARKDRQGMESMLENFGDEVGSSDYVPVDESSGNRVSVGKTVGSPAFSKSYEEQSRRTEEALQAWYKHLDEYPEPKGIFADIGQSDKATADAWINWMPMGPSSSYSDPSSDSSAGGGSSLRGREGPIKHGFDDDFADFVSAPPLSSKSNSASGRDSPDSDESGDMTVLKHEYESLSDEAGDVQTRGASEGEGDEDGQEEEQEEQEDREEGEKDKEEVHSTVVDEDDNDTLPSKEEIQETAQKIFGTAQKSDVSSALFSPPLSTTKSKPTEAFSIDALSELIAQGSGGASTDLAAFDIPKVLGALQHMKAEIAGMKNEDERRKAAAKVALGLVYGLEAEAEVENVLGGPR